MVEIMENNYSTLIEEKRGEKDPSPHLLQAKKTRRMFGAIIDMCIVTLAGMILSAVAAIPLTGFNEMNTQAYVEFEEMRALFEATKLYKIDEEGNAAGDDEMYADYLTAKLSSDAEVYVNDDVLMYYYVENQEQSVAYFNREILGLPEAIDGENASPFWQYGDDVNEPALLKADVKDQLALHLAGTTSESTSALYANFKTFFVDSMKEARTHFSDLATTIAAYDEYAVIILAMMERSAIAAGITFIVVSIIFYIVLPLIKKDGRTLAKRVMGMTVVGMDGEKPKPGSIIIRGVLEIITFSLTLVFVPFLNWGYSSFDLPILRIGDFAITYLSIGLASFAISLVSLIVMAISSDARSIHDFAAHTMVYDTNMWKTSKINEDLNK